MHHLDVTVNYFLSSFSPLFGKFHNNENIICELTLRAPLNPSICFNLNHMDSLLISFYLTNTKLSKCHRCLQFNSMELLRLCKGQNSKESVLSRELQAVFNW